MNMKVEDQDRRIMEKEDYNLYIIAELTYKKRHPNEEKLFPTDWYSSTNYKLKTEIIAEAIKNNIPIEETSLYQNKFIEKVILKKE